MTLFIGAVLTSLFCVTTITPVMDADKKPPTVSLTTWDGNDRISSVDDKIPSVKGALTINAAASDNMGVARIEIFIDGTPVKSQEVGTSGKSTASLSYQWDTTTWEEGYHEIKTVAYDHQGLSTTTIQAVTVDNVAEKIGVFFYSTDTFRNMFGVHFPGEDTRVSIYINAIKSRGYTKIFRFEDSAAPYPDLYEVRDYEGTSDTIFFYLMGHGANSGTSSLTKVSPNAGLLYSNVFRSRLEPFDSPRIAIVVDSCFSGGWVEDFKSGNYLAISSTDLWHYGLGFGSSGLCFSENFFWCIEYGYNEYQAFISTPWWVTWWSLPQITPHDSYVFFPWS